MTRSPLSETSPTVRIIVRVPKDDADRFRAVCRRGNVTLSEKIRELMAKASRGA